MILQSYKNIPRQLVEFKDGGLAFRTNEPTITTKSVLILGTAKDGPKDPVAIDIDTVETLYGKDVNPNGTPNGASIPKAVNELYRAGCRDIRVMRFTGEVASVTINNASRSVTQPKKMEETLGYAEGNDSTQLTLSKSNVIESSIQVYAKGVLISATLTFDDATKKLTVPADVCDAGAALTVKYQYTNTEADKAIKETLTVDASSIINLAHTPKASPVITYNGATMVVTTDYTVAGKEVTFVDLLPGSVVNVEYSADVVTTISVSESGTGVAPFKAAGGTQVFSLVDVPEADSLHVYVNDNEMLSVDAFGVDATAKTLTISKDRFAKDSLISVTYFTNSTVTVNELVEFSSVFAGTPYNEGYIDIEEIVNKDSIVIGKKIKITKPVAKRASNELPLEYTSLDYPTFGQLVDIINKDLRNGVFKAKTDFVEAHTASLVKGRYQFAGGEDGLNCTKPELFEKLSGKRDANGYLLKEGAYQLLENYNVDYVVLTGVYADDQLLGKYDAFDYELALFCAVVSHQSKTTYGAIEMTPCTDTSLLGIKTYADKLAAWNSNGLRYLMKVNGKIYTDSNGEPIDLGKFIRVIGGPDPLFMSDTLGVHYAFGAVAYAGLQSVLPSQSSATNKKIPGSKGVRYRFSAPQLDAITGANIITFKQKFDNRGNTLEGAYVVDSMTCARPGSDYTRTTTCEVVRDCIDDIRDVADPFLGEPTTVEQKNALASAISKRLGIRKEQGVIVDYMFQIVASQSDNVLGKCRIELTIVPPQELREITTVVGLTPALQ